MGHPLFVVLLLIETTDVIFAVDSIPAILAVTRDPFIVYTSNVFAILGLRALYFALAGIMQLFHYLHYGLSLILVFVGTKMLLSDVYKVPIGIALAVIAGILIISVVASILRPRRDGSLPLHPVSPRRRQVDIDAVHHADAAALFGIFFLSGLPDRALLAYWNLLGFHF
ncbi:MAG: hypothetical protein MPW15_13680 [Candidatus Manganitrophus sp.]|nr:hypothetical protein [Candidatus Manganitrophus sp.]